MRFLCTLLCLMVCACAAGQPATIRDLNVLPQNAGHYLPDPDKVYIDSDSQARLYQNFLTRFFLPWNRDTPKHTGEEVFSGFARFKSKAIFGENNLPLPADWIDQMARKSDTPAYPSRHIPAIAVVHASMRVFPTHKPLFFSPGTPGEGFPFDRMQNSLVAAGTPLLITHVSRDGEWALVETDWAAGWVRWPEIARVDREFITAWTAPPLVGFWADNVPLRRPDGMFLLSGRVGMALPLAGEGESPEYRMLRVPARDHLGQAKFLTAVVPEKDCRKLPFPASRQNFVRILDGLLGQNYGWGGLYENRDCSALMQDVLAGFGVFLPRNSKDQAGAGRFVSLEGLGQREKQRLILSQGKPLLTILYMPGHVMLYLGSDPASGRVVVYHALWGVRTVRCFENIPGRRVLGKTLITSLEAGKELVPFARPGGLLIERLTGMVLLD
jgi:hypothetical protein